MAAKTTKDVMAWFKINVAGFTSEITGLSDTHVAIYIKLMMLYWSSGNKLPNVDSKLHRRLGITDDGGKSALADILNEFFPFDLEQDYAHSELDRQLNDIIGNSRKQSERASRPRGTAKQPVQINPEYDEDNF